MPDRPAALALLTVDGDARLLTQASRGVIQVTRCATFAGVRAHLANPRFGVFICRRLPESARATDAAIRAARAANTQLVIIVIAPQRGGVSADIRSLEQLGVARVIRDAERHLRPCLIELVAVERFRLARVALANRCAATAPYLAREAIRYAVTNGHRPLSVEQLAEGIGVPRKTLDRRLARKCGVTARQMIGWSRVTCAAMRLEDGARTVADVASELAFSSPSALRNLLQRYLGLTPTQLRDVGGSEHAISRLISALSATLAA